MASLFLEAIPSARVRVPVPASVYLNAARPTAAHAGNLLLERRGVKGKVYLERLLGH
jgi:hypothetical protein